MLPELVVAHLTGEVVAETTSAGSTGLLDLATRDWSAELCDAIGLPRALLPDILPAGTPVGSWRGVPVHLVGGHDTASAVLGGRSTRRGVRLRGHLAARRPRAGPSRHERRRLQAAGFTNEQGALGGVRFLRNVAGWWLVEECRRAWDGDLDQLLADAAAVPDPDVLVDATDERFLAPSNMEHELRTAAGLAPTPSRADRSSASRSSRWRQRPRR